jgi:Acetyltransferase (GNAT) domain
MIEPAMRSDAQLYDPAMKEQWDSFIAQAKNGNFLFFRDYMEYHRDRFEDHSIMFFVDGVLLACLPANRVGAILHSHQGLTYGGLVMHRDIRRGQAFAIMSALKQHMRSQGMAALRYKPMPYLYHALPSDEDIDALTRLGGRIIDTRVTCATRTGDRPAFSMNRRQDVKRFAKSALVVSRSYDFPTFMNLCAAQLWRSHSARPVHSVEEIASLAARFPDFIRLYAVHRGSEMIAGIVVYRNSCCAKIQYVGQSEPAERSGALAALYEYILERALPNGLWLEFGHSVDPRGVVNEGVHSYKESLGARSVQMRDYELNAGPCDEEASPRS